MEDVVSSRMLAAERALTRAQKASEPDERRRENTTTLMGAAKNGGVAVAGELDGGLPPMAGADGR